MHLSDQTSMAHKVVQKSEGPFRISTTAYSLHPAVPPRKDYARTAQV